MTTRVNRISSLVAVLAAIAFAVGLFQPTANPTSVSAAVLAQATAYPGPTATPACPTCPVEGWIGRADAKCGQAVLAEFVRKDCDGRLEALACPEHICGPLVGQWARMNGGALVVCDPLPGTGSGLTYRPVHWAMAVTSPCPTTIDSGEGRIKRNNAVHNGVVVAQFSRTRCDGTHLGWLWCPENVCGPLVGSWAHVNSDRGTLYSVNPPLLVDFVINATAATDPCGSQATATLGVPQTPTGPVETPTATAMPTGQATDEPQDCAYDGVRVSSEDDWRRVLAHDGHYFQPCISTDDPDGVASWSADYNSGPMIASISGGELWYDGNRDGTAETLLVKYCEECGVDIVKNGWYRTITKAGASGMRLRPAVKPTALPPMGTQVISDRTDFAKVVLEPADGIIWMPDYDEKDNNPSYRVVITIPAGHTQLTYWFRGVQALMCLGNVAEKRDCQNGRLEIAEKTNGKPIEIEPGGTYTIWGNRYNGAFQLIPRTGAAAQMCAQQVYFVCETFGLASDSCEAATERSRGHTVVGNPRSCSNWNGGTIWCTRYPWLCR